MSDLKQYLFAFLLLLLPISVLAKQPPAMATGGSSLNVIFLVDNTLSMRELNKYLAVRDALSKLINNPSLASQANFSLLTWGQSTCTWGTTVSCGTYTVRTRTASGTFITQTFPKYQWVPLSTNKQQNYIDMTNAVSLINAVDIGTNVDPPMNFIENYLNSAAFSQQFNVCGNTIVIVLSDGLWNVSQGYKVAARLLAKSPSIKTFAVAFGEDPSATTFTAMAKAGGTTKGLGGFTVDADVLASTFMAAIQSAMLDTYTSVAPTILPSTAAGDLILAPEFEYSPTTQWKGYLRANKLSSTGAVDTQLWELGQNLSAVLPDNRNIWTAIPGLVAPTRNSSVTPNNLLYTDSASMTAITSAMETNGALSATTALNDATNLVKFIRGFDVFDEDTNASTLYRWKLNDIYNSKPTFVGQPIQSINTDPAVAGGIAYFYNKNSAAYDTFRAKTRTPMVYVGANDGLLHAVSASDGQEQWAFLPPPLMNKMKNVLTSVSNNTNSIYGVDGAVVAQDVYINNEWRTYLAITLGLGGMGFSIIDITDPLRPLHVLSIENFINNNGTRTIKKWGADGSYSTTTGYEKLGYTKSAPIFSYAKDGSNYQPVLVLGAGISNSGITSGVGSAVFVISLQPSTAGNIIATKDVSSLQNPSTSTVTINTSAANNSSNILFIANTYALDIGSGVSGTGIAANTVITSIDGGMQITLNQDTTGSVPTGTALTFTRRIFNEVEPQVELLESGSTTPMSGIYGFKMLVPNNNGLINSFDETAPNVSSLANNSSAFTVIESGTSFANDRLINQALSVSADTANATANLNVLYGTGDMDMLSLIDKSPSNLIVSVQDAEANLFGKTVSRPFTQFLNATSTNVNTCVSSSQQGWYADINTTTALDAANNAIACSSGKLSSKIETYGGLATIPLYIPPQPSSANYCTGGDSAVIFRNAKCGYQTSKGIYLKQMTIGGVVAYKNNIYISVSSKNTTTAIDSTGNFTKTGNIITGQPNFSMASPNRLSVKSKVRVH
jgi:hypothetical protein